LQGTATLSISRVDFLTHHALHPSQEQTAAEEEEEEFDDNGYNQNGIHMDDIKDNDDNDDDDIDDDDGNIEPPAPHRNATRSSSSPKSRKIVRPKKHDDIVETTGVKGTVS
jgi:hypothetical protein